MKLAWHAFIFLVLINLLLAGGFVAWMYSSGRISQERVDLIVDTFRMTIDEEAAEQAKIEQLELESQKTQEQQARLASTGEGPVPLRERLDRNQASDEITDTRIQFFNEQNRALREEMARFKDDHAKRVAELEEAEQAFQQWIDDYAAKTKDENFQQVVKLYESQPAKQTKQAFQTLIQLGETDQVVDYLSAMSKRKAAQVLSQFKTPPEVAQAAQLLEKLRKRGEYTIEDNPPTPGNQT